MSDQPQATHPVTRRLRKVAFVLLLGLVTSVAMAWVLALLVDPRFGRCESEESAVGNGYWSVHSWSRPGVMLVESIYQAKGDRSWGVEQMIGAPDTPGSGDIPSAWASNTQDGQPEWLVLDYAEAVVPAAVHVVETYNPGALTKVSVFTSSGKEVVAWEGADPTAAGSGHGISKIPLKVSFPVRRVKVYLDSPAVPGWNEIDAVALVDRQGRTQWAAAAQASSTYATGFGSTGAPARLIPMWSHLAPPDGDSATPPDKNVRRVWAGFGWPFPAMYGQKDISPGTTSQPSFVVVSRGMQFVASPRAPATPTPLPLPYRLVWTGLLLDAVLWGLLLWLLYLVLTWPVCVFRELMRLRRGQCLMCGYDLRYDFVRGCPECGWRRVPPVSSPGEFPLNPPASRAVGARGTENN